MRKWFWRIAILSAAVAFASNFALRAPQPTLLPASVGEWRLASQTVFQPVPAELKNFRKAAYARKAWRAAYAGNPPMTLTVYEMPHFPAIAFDAFQQWQAAPGRMAFFKGDNFAIVESPGATPDQISRFARSLALNGAPTGSGFLLR